MTHFESRCVYIYITYIHGLSGDELSQCARSAFVQFACPMVSVWVVKILLDMLHREIGRTHLNPNHSGRWASFFHRCFERTMGDLGVSWFASRYPPRENKRTPTVLLGLYFETPILLRPCGHCRHCGTGRPSQRLFLYQKVGS